MSGPNNSLCCSLALCPIAAVVCAFVGVTATMGLVAVFGGPRSMCACVHVCVVDRHRRSRDIIKLPEDISPDGCPELLQVRPCTRPIPLSCSVSSAAPQCPNGPLNGVVDGRESDVDCGGPAQDTGCARCLEGGRCRGGDDCVAGLVCSRDSVCVGAYRQYCVMCLRVH